MDVILRIIGLIALLTFVNNASSKSLEEDEFSLSFGDEDFISIATGSRQPIARAPSVATVITAVEIKAMGATNLDEVLETVPGLHVSLSSIRFSPIYSIRGIYTDNNPQVLMLMDGVPMTQVFAGDRGSRSTMPVSDISRVEVIRGPGSAIYGADAFSGVINIITKRSQDIDGTEFGIRAGSYNTKNGWLLHEGKLADLDYSLSLEWNDTNGDDNRIIKSDAQTIFDNLVLIPSSLPPVSLAPGPADTRQKRIDIHLDISKDKWRFNIWNWRQINSGVGPGLALALDPSGRGDTDNYMASLFFNDLELDEYWKSDIQLSYMDINTTSEQKLFPPGSILPIGIDGNINPITPNGLVLFTDGFIGNPEVYEQNARVDASTFYTGFEDHKIRIGIGLANAKLEAKETKNYGPGVIDGTVTPIDGTLTDVSNTPFIFIGDKSRTLKYLSLQDEWSFAPDWNLTAGVRYDDYSDFGDTVNPRIALVWQTLYNMTSKLMYGRAFRAPSFQELYNINNPVALGNPNLDPETIGTTELAFDFQNSDNVHTNLSIFSYTMSDIISFVPDISGASIAQNTGEQKGYGFEVEANIDVNSDIKISGNYAWQNSTDEETNSDAANAPGQQMYVQTDWRFIRDWKLNVQANWVADRKRAVGDPRPEINDYTTVDIALHYKPENSLWSFSLLGKNVFDEDGREPSPYSPTGIAIPDDFPLPGSSFFLEAEYKI